MEEEKLYAMFETVETVPVGKLKIPAPVTIMYFGEVFRKSEEEIGLTGYKAKRSSSAQEMNEIAKGAIKEVNVEDPGTFSQRINLGIMKCFYELILNNFKKGERGAYSIPVDIIKGETYREVPEDEVKTITDFLKSGCETFHGFTEHVKNLEAVVQS